MIRSNADPSLEYFLKELSYLRRSGANYAQIYPKVARRLDFGQGESSDPHTERLLESFAFLTARLQEDIDNQLPYVSTALLSVLYPQMTQPIPSMSIAYFAAETDQAKSNAAYKIKRKTSLFTHTAGGEICRFRTAYDVELAPVVVDSVKLVRTEDYKNAHLTTKNSRMLRLRLKSTAGTFGEIGLDNIKFYINAPNVSTAHVIYEGLFSYTGDRVSFAEAGSEQLFSLPKGSLKPVGFSEEEALLEYPKHANSAYRLLQEFFVFPEKFFFFQVNYLERVSALSEIDLFLPISNEEELLRVELKPSLFLTGCTPIINLFPKTSEPIRIDQKQIEYRLSADYKRELYTEIHSIEKVIGVNDDTGEEETIYPYYGLNYEGEINEAKHFWYARRKTTNRLDLPGTELHLSFVNLNLDVNLPPNEVVFAKTLCTNRQVASSIPAGGKLNIEEAVPAETILCLQRPTRVIYPPESGQTQWHLISQLSLNHLSLGNLPECLLALKKILLLHSQVNQRTDTRDIESLAKMTCKPVVRCMQQEAWRGFVRGTSIELEFDENLGEGSNDFLLASVLNHFFALYASINSFTELTIKSNKRKGIWKQWQPLSGSHALL